MQIKITDFGLSRHNDDLQTSRMTGLAGTFHWMAPEVLQSDEYTHKADVYSYAIVLWEIIMREPPFNQKKAPEIISGVIQGMRPEMSRIPKDVPKEMIDIMTQCWNHDPNRRPDMIHVIKYLKKIESKFI